MSKETVRIAHIIGKMWAGGVEAVVFNYYRAIDHDEIQFDFFYDEDSTVEPPQDIIEMGARFYKMPPYQKLWLYIPQLIKLLRLNNYTIVHSHLNTLSVFPLFAAWIAGVKIRIAHNHSVPGGSEWKRNLAKNILKHFSTLFATHYFACSEKAGRWLFGDRIYENGSVEIIKNAIDFERFHRDDIVKKSLAEKYDLEGHTVYGHVGRFTFAKNHMKLLSIFHEIYLIDNEARFVLVGDGELRQQIENKIHELGLDDVVICTGKVNNPESYYSIIDVMILPSNFEGLPMTVIESQITGVPIIVSYAVPKEAVISNGCVFMELECEDNRWANEAISLTKHKVILNSASEEYDIRKQAQKLQIWYMKRVGKQCE